MNLYLDDFRNLHGQEKAGCCELLLVSGGRGRAKQLSTALAHWGTPRAEGFTVFTAWIQCCQWIFRFCLLKQKAAEQSLHFRRRKGCPVERSGSSKMNYSHTPMWAGAHWRRGLPASPWAQPWQQRAGNSCHWQNGRRPQQEQQSCRENIASTQQLPDGSHAYFSCRFPLFVPHHHLPHPQNPSFPVLSSPTIPSLLQEIINHRDSH